MAVPTGSGTETVQSVLLEDVNASQTTIIEGVQHHIYTVLSVTINCRSVHASSNDMALYLKGYDSAAGESDQYIYLANWVGVLDQTFVWNDKFSFFGYEPSSNTQAARAAQAGSTSQKLQLNTSNAACKVDITCTYIDQDWS